MSEERLSGVDPGPTAAPICPWCSAALAATDAERCPSCGAVLREADGSEVPGVTRVDHEALLRSRAPVQPARGLIGWLSGEYQSETPAPAPGTLEPPGEAVRREMLRLELVALEAEVQARRVEAIALAAEGRGSLDAGADAPGRAADSFDVRDGGEAAESAVEAAVRADPGVPVDPGVPADAGVPADPDSGTPEQPAGEDLAGEAASADPVAAPGQA